MPNIATFNTLHQRVKQYQKDYKLQTLALAFDWLAVETLLSLTPDDLEEAITDGPQDEGVDAIQVDLDDASVHVFSFKYTDNFEKSKDNFPANEVNKLLVTIDAILDRSITETSVNRAVWERVQAVWHAYDTLPKVTLHVYFCSNKEHLPVAAQEKVKTHLRKYLTVRTHFINQEELVLRLLERERKGVSGTITFIDKQYFERTDAVMRGVVATIAATDLVKLVQDPDDPSRINDDVINDNVRIYLKLKNKVNRGIYDSALSQSNYEFWYLNNGITIVCEDCSYQPHLRSPVVTLTNYQIVNGGQTTNALFEAFRADEEQLRNVMLLVRICVTRQHEISEKISESTNRQTPVNGRDIHANDRIQRLIGQQFDALGYYYERKRGQYSDKPAANRINNEVLGQVWLAYHLDKPSEAKNQKNRVFADLYDTIFDEDSASAEAMLVPYRIYQRAEELKSAIQRKKRSGDPITSREAYTAYATFHVVRGVKLIVERDGIDISDDAILRATIEKALDYVGEVVERVQKERADYSHDKFFKEVETNNLIRRQITGVAAASTGSPSKRKGSPRRRSSTKKGG